MHYHSAFGTDGKSSPDEALNVCVNQPADASFSQVHRGVARRTAYLWLTRNVRPDPSRLMTILNRSDEMTLFPAVSEVTGLFCLVPCACDSAGGSITTGTSLARSASR